MRKNSDLALKIEGSYSRLGQMRHRLESSKEREVKLERMTACCMRGYYLLRAKAVKERTLLLTEVTEVSAGDSGKYNLIFRIR